jgi:hypothetical protein
MEIILMSALLATITTTGLYSLDFRFTRTPKHRK